MWLVPIPLLVWLVVALCEEEITEEAPSPCDNYYEYVCSQPNAEEWNARFRDVREEKVPQSVDQYQEYVFPTSEPAKRLWDVIDPVVVSTWMVQFNTYVHGPDYLLHQKKHEETIKLARPEMLKALENQSESFKTKILLRFYTSLRASCEKLDELKLPISTHNPFYHGLFEDLKELQRSEIRKHSRYTDEQKQKLIDKVDSVRVIFPLFDYNNVTVWRQAKTAFEREYYQLKALINETEIPTRTVEHLILIASVKPAMDIFTNYMTEFTPRFVFQNVLATSTKDSFHYQGEIHASILTFFNPQKSPNLVYTRFLFVLSHEFQHAFYNTDPPLFNAPEWEKERQCLVDKINFFGENWLATVPQRNLEDVYYEDMSNMAGLRFTMMMNARRSSDPQQIRDALEDSMKFMCSHLNGSIDHNPLDVSMNVAASQLPTFSSLYNCVPGDRLYVETKDLCTTLNMAIDGDDYEEQKVDENELSTLSKFMDVLENTAVELDAANITTFEGELFDVTVEDVEDQEEVREGSASSSSSSQSSESAEKGDEGRSDEELTDALEDADEEIEKAEIKSSSKLSFTAFSLAVLVVLF